MILLGAAISASIPLLETMINTLFHVHIVPSFNYYLPFLIVFPLSVGYSIVKHNLFDIDAIIKRTYGYVLTTGCIAGVYGLVVFLLEPCLSEDLRLRNLPSFRSSLSLLLSFFFNPIRNRVQKIH